MRAMLRPRGRKDGIYVKALVTGAAGFVGANLVRELIQDGIEVTGFVRRDSDLRNLQGLNVKLVFGDIRESEAVKEAMRGYDLLFHVAAMYSVDPSLAGHMYAVNVHGTKVVMEAALAENVKAAVHTSSIGTIGRTKNGTPPNEETDFNSWLGGSDYAKSKYLGELVALAFCQKGLPVVVVHPCAPIGAYDIKPSSSGQRVVDVLNGVCPHFLEGGINFVAVKDVARGHILAAQKGVPGERYILGNENLAYDEFLRLVENVSGQKSPRTWGRSDVVTWLKQAFLRRNKPTIENWRALTCDCSKAVRELGLPQSSLEFALRDAVAWFVDNGYVRRDRRQHWTSCRTTTPTGPS